MRDGPFARIGAIGRAVPERAFTQVELRDYSPWEPTPLLERLLLDSAIRTRSLYVHPDTYRTPRTLTETNAAWKEGATALSAQALEDALHTYGAGPADLDLIGVTTVTGYATPGLDLLLAHQLGMRPDLDRFHFNNIGCHAAIPLLRVAADHVARRPGTVGAAVAVEVCSACFTGSADPQNIVASTLFADGAAAVILSTDAPGPALVDFASAFDYAHIDALGFSLGAEGFRIVLDPSIPDHVAASVAGVVDQLLARNGLTRRDIALWGVHPGGARIVDAAQRALGLSDAQLVPTRRVLRNHGNMSSPTILFVLAEALDQLDPEPGTFGVVAAFGPGLGVETALLRF